MSIRQNISSGSKYEPIIGFSRGVPGRFSPEAWW